MITKDSTGFTYTTTQTSTDSTVDMYWQMVNNRYINIVNKVRYAYSRDWIDGCISDIGYAISHCQYIKDTKLREAYIQSFNLIRNNLLVIKQGLTK